MGSKVRRVYDGPRTPFERVKASPQADREKVAKLEELRKSLDPFQLARAIERKLERIYRLSNRRLSPKELQKPARREKGCGIDIGIRSPVFPVTPPYMRVRIRRFGGLSYRLRNS